MIPSRSSARTGSINSSNTQTTNMSSSDSFPQSFPQQKRIIPPPMPIDLPTPAVAQSYDALSNSPMSRSPLRNSITMDPKTGKTLSEDSSALEIDNHDPWSPTAPRETSHSPAPSITRFASSFAQRVGSLVSSVSPNSQNMALPTEAEIEAEAEFQREQSRKEAERILSQEARERKNVEERVLEMLESDDVRPRSQTLPSSPASNKEGGLSWWSSAKNKLTSGKEKDLTPAQQIIAETKAKEKEKRKSREVDVFSDNTIKVAQQRSHALSLPPGARPPSAMVGGGTSLVEGPSTPNTQTPFNPRTPSPSRSPGHGSINLSSIDLTRLPGASPSLSTTSKDTVPLYAHFTTQGTLDIPATLLTIARRFEKLERWSVNHVRALEERMRDVEKWLVDKENERQRQREKELEERPASDSSRGTQPQPQASPQVVREITIERKMVEVDQEVKREVTEMKEELGELRSRVTELGQEMARIITSESPSHPATPSEVSGFGIGRLGSPVFGSAGPSTPMVVKPKTQTVASRHERDSPSSNSMLQSETASIISTNTAMRTKLPYPTGDYTSPSPPNSPRGSIVSASTVSNLTRTRPTSNGNDVGFTQALPSPDTTTPAQFKASNSFSPQVSASPKARKRYTVALGQPLSSPSSSSYERPKENELPPLNMLGGSKLDFGEGLFSEPQVVQLETTFMSNSGEKQNKGDESPEINLDEDEETGIALRKQETIGKTPIELSRLSTSPPPSRVSSPNIHGAGLYRSPARASNTRLRAQSSYGAAISNVTGPAVFARSSVNLPTLSNNESMERKLSLKSRTRSIDRFNLKDTPSTLPGNNFVDPLIVRKRVTAANRMSVPVQATGQRGRVADLRALFDADKR